jgi:hypothetical protein
MATADPTPSPAPAPPEAAARAIALLASALAVPAGEIGVRSFAHAVWPNAGLGCPEPGVFYVEAVTPGWTLTLARGGDSYVFHSDATGAQLVNCTELRTRFADTVNPVAMTGLENTAYVVIRRLDGATGEYHVATTVASPSEVEEFVGLLDIDIPLSEPTGCRAIFQVEYHAPSAVHTFDYICADDFRMVRGRQEFWGGKEGRAPSEFGNLVGKYVSKQPLPMLPDD